MAADIFFTDSIAWSSSSVGFVDLITRAIGKCRSNEQPLVQILSEAEEIRCLGINLQVDRGLQIILTERVLEAALETLQELNADPATHPAEISSIEELVAAAQVHLRGLNSSLT